MLGFDETSSKRYRLSFEMHGSPTDNLLRDCKYRMVRIRHLYKILMEIGLVQLAQEVLGDFDTEEELTPQSYNVNGMPSYQSRLANPGEKMSSVADRKPEQATSSKREQWSGLDTYHFHYSDIKQGTNNFSRALELGAGAFGKVYKVTLRNTLFACKVLKIDKENPLTTSIIETHRKHDDLRNELNYLAEYRHPNVISLYGWSLDGPDPCLVYEFMSNGSLQDRLQCSGDSRPLTWEQRVKISCGAARGLQFLHTSKSKPLIHGDIKTANILLDES
uniref:Protein kinase domain-containing protein n=2 Tax=Ciona intestinalis TaxID=7719 RepID=F7A9Z4_CIOIN